MEGGKEGGRERREGEGVTVKYVLHIPSLLTVDSSMVAHTLFSVILASGILFQLKDLSTCDGWGMAFLLALREDKAGVRGGGAPASAGGAGGCGIPVYTKIDYGKS